MRWLDIGVRIVRAALVGLVAALVAMLGFSILESVGEELATRSVAADDPNPFAVALVPIGIYTGIAAGVGALTWPAPRPVAWFWGAIVVRALSLAALVGYLSARIADLIVAVEPVLSWLLAALTFALVPAVAHGRRPAPTIPAGSPGPAAPPGPPARPAKPKVPGKGSTVRRTSRRP